MSSLRLVVLLLCVVPLQGLAQESKPEGAAPAYPTPPPLVPAPGEPEEATEASGEEPAGEPPQGEIIPREPRRDQWIGGRVALELLGGSLIGFVGLLPGAYLSIRGISSESSDQFFTGLAVMAVGLSTGASLGVVGAGGLVGVEGRFLPTFAGAGLGMGAGLLLALTIGPTVGEIAFIPMLAAPIIGAIVGYEFSHARALATEPAPTETAPQVMPLVTVTPRGGILGGLVGRF